MTSPGFGGVGMTPNPGFDAAQNSFDNETPDYLEDYPDRSDDWCDNCGDQAVCPECKGT